METFYVYLENWVQERPPLQEVLSDQYTKNKDQIVGKIKDYMENYDNYKRALEKQKLVLSRMFFSGEALYKAIK